MQRWLVWLGSHDTAIWILETNTAPRRLSRKISMQSAFAVSYAHRLQCDVGFFLSTAIRPRLWCCYRFWPLTAKHVSFPACGDHAAWILAGPCLVQACGIESELVISISLSITNSMFPLHLLWSWWFCSEHVLSDYNRFWIFAYGVYIECYKTVRRSWTHESNYWNISDTWMDHIEGVCLLYACHSSSQRNAICNVQVASDRQRCSDATSTPNAPGVSN